MALVRNVLRTIANDRRLHRALTRPAVSRLVAPAMKPLARRIPQSLLFEMPVTGRSTVRLDDGTEAFRFIVDPGDTISKILFWYGLGGYEPQTLSLISTLAGNASTFVDVGANTGVYSLLVAAQRSDVAVHAIEPVPSVFARLSRNAELNRFENLFLHELAVSDRTGPAEIHVPVGEVPLESSLLRRFRPGTEAVTVGATTLDDLVADSGIGRVDLMKVDTEGTTQMVIAGARRTLSRDAPFLVCEILHNVDTDTGAWPMLEQLGYRPFLLTSSGLVRDCQVLGDPKYRDMNYLFVHADRLDEVSWALPTS